MQEKWRKYESLMLFAPELDSTATEELVQRARGFVSQEGGRILKTGRWGLRDLAFELKGRNKAYYLLLEFGGLPTVATELNRRLNLIDTVLKFQTIKREDQVDPETLEEEVDTPPAAAEEAPEEAPAEPVAETPDPPAETPPAAETAAEATAAEPETEETPAEETPAVETPAVEAPAAETAEGKAE